MSVDQCDVAEFFCNTKEDAQKILDYLKALSETQKKFFKEVRGWKMGSCHRGLSCRL